MEFLNYKVSLQLKDGTQTSGLVSHVDGSIITLGTETYSNSAVKDLKVVQLPPDFKNKRKNGPSGGAASGAASGPPSARQSDSAKSEPAKQKKKPDWEADVQSIKHSEDFDFAANLAMFDKKTVFADFQKNDSVSAQERLVGHNKVEPKTADDKYEIDEMVLPGDQQDNWHSIGSLSQRRASPALPAGPAAGAFVARDTQQFRFTFENSPASVPLASPVQLLEIERAVHTSFGIDNKSLIEVCAVNLYKLVVTKVLGAGVRLSKRNNHNLPPLVLLLIGSGRCSSRAFALGRHLTNHGVRVLAYVINEEMVEDELLEQCQLFEKCGGKVVSSALSGLMDILHNQLETPVELVVDALQGFESSLPDLFYTKPAMATLKDLVSWVNKQRNKVMSLDIAAGIDGGSGTVVDASLHVKSNCIVSLGLPITGLMHAYNHGKLADDVEHYVVDCGIPNALYSSKPHLRKFDKFWYCAEEYMKLEVASE